MRIGVIGVGSIGGTLADAYAQLGHDIRINDTDPDAQAKLPYKAATKNALAEWSDIIVIAVPTPTNSHGGDASIVDDTLDPLRATDATVVIRSTMPPGTTNSLAEKHGLPLVYSPEFLRDRSTVEDVFEADRLVLACPDPDERATARQLLDDPGISNSRVIELSDYLTAEIGKEAHNALFATKVSFANQIRDICVEAGGDPEAVMDIVTADSRNTSSHLDPMLGPYGGKCLPKDTRALAHYGDRQGATTSLLKGTINMNQEARRRWENVEIDGEWPNIKAKGD